MRTAKFKTFKFIEQHSQTPNLTAQLFFYDRVFANACNRNAEHIICHLLFRFYKPKVYGSTAYLILFYFGLLGVVTEVTGKLL
ncbi:MAG: hypothetical protein ACHQYQ_04710 [Bacteriovoracales bacterium]